jgi:hypothetical protein
MRLFRDPEDNRRMDLVVAVVPSTQVYAHTAQKPETPKQLRQGLRRYHSS